MVRMAKRCKLCSNHVKDGEDYCWRHSDKPKEINKDQIKRHLRAMLKDYGEKSGAGYESMLQKYKKDTSKAFEKEKRRFKKLEENHRQVKGILDELFLEL